MISTNFGRKVFREVPDNVSNFDANRVGRFRDIPLKLNVDFSKMFVLPLIIFFDLS